MLPWALGGLVVLVLAVAIVGVFTLWPSSVVGFPAGFGKMFRDCADCPEMVVIPSGAGTMGSSTSDVDHTPEEAPQHPVQLAKPLAFGRYPITRAEFAAYARETTPAPTVSSPHRSRRPIGIQR